MFQISAFRVHLRHRKGWQTLRHTGATVMVRAGISLRAVQMIRWLVNLADGGALRARDRRGVCSSRSRHSRTHRRGKTSADKNADSGEKCDGWECLEVTESKWFVPNGIRTRVLALKGQRQVGSVCPLFGQLPPHTELVTSSVLTLYHAFSSSRHDRRSQIRSHSGVRQPAHTDQPGWAPSSIRAAPRALSRRPSLEQDPEAGPVGCKGATGAPKVRVDPGRRAAFRPESPSPP